MTEFKKQVKTFAGKVTIQDIQEEFDRLITGINNAVNTINSMNGIADLDFTKGSNRLSSKNYTLTLGSLKQVLNLYDGTVLGGTCVNINGACKTFPLLYVSRDKGIIHLKDQYLQANDKAIDLFFNPDTKDIGFPAGDWTEVDSSGAGEVYTDLKTNNDWGSMSCDKNASDAYKITSRSGEYFVPQDNPVLGMNAPFEITWTFPNKRTLQQVVFGVQLGTDSSQFIYPNNYYTISTLEGTVLKEQSIVGQYTGNQTISIDTGTINVKTNGIKITCTTRSNNTMANMTVLQPVYHHSLAVQVAAKQEYTYEGTPTQSGIEDLTGYERIAMLDWKRGYYNLNTTDDDILCLPDNMPALNITATQFTNTGKIPLNNSSKACFFIPCCQFAGEGAARTVELQGTTISRFGGDGHKSNSWIWAYNPIWVPSNLAITVTGNWNKMLNYKMVSKGEQT